MHPAIMEKYCKTMKRWIALILIQINILDINAINISNVKTKYVCTLLGAKSHAITVSALASIWCCSNKLGSE